jgi:predicted  nucleic acid-binding Zn-ribbon protein
MARISNAASTSTGRASAARMTNPKDSDPRSLVRALGRELSRLQSMESELAEAERRADGLRRERDEQKRRTDATEASLSTLVQALESIQAIRHGKRVDRRLAKAQKLAERGLKKALAGKAAAAR